MQNNRSTVWGCGQEFRTLCMVARYDLSCLLLCRLCSILHFNSRLANCPGNRGHWALVQRPIWLEGRAELSSIGILIFSTVIYLSILQRDLFFLCKLVSTAIKQHQWQTGNSALTVWLFSLILIIYSYSYASHHHFVFLFPQFCATCFRTVLPPWVLFRVSNLIICPLRFQVLPYSCLLIPGLEPLTHRPVAKILLTPKESLTGRTAINITDLSACYICTPTAAPTTEITLFGLTNCPSAGHTWVSSP